MAKLTTEELSIVSVEALSVAEQAEGIAQKALSRVDSVGGALDTLAGKVDAQRRRSGVVSATEPPSPVQDDVWVVVPSGEVVVRRGDTWQRYGFAVLSDPETALAADFLTWVMDDKNISSIRIDRWRDLPGLGEALWQWAGVPPMRRLNDPDDPEAGGYLVPDFDASTDDQRRLVVDMGEQGYALAADRALSRCVVGWPLLWICRRTGRRGEIRTWEEAGHLWLSAEFIG